MITGMTGFGSCDIAGSQFRGTIEVKTQNHRYLDISFYLPVGYAALEDRIRQLIGKEIARGRVNVAVKINEKNVQSLSLNEQLVGEYFKHAKILEKKYGLKNDLSLSGILRLPGVVESREVRLDEDVLWGALEKALKKALHGVVVMRKREGKCLSVEMATILKRMLVQIKNVQTRLKKLLADKKKEVSLEEFSSFQKSNDVGEEITRLSHYVQEFKALLKTTAGVGKKMDFIAQEMQRETNTIGSKVQDALVSNAVIALKSKIEKLREQAQNIE